MKKLLIFVLVMLTAFGAAYCIDAIRMSNGETVIFSTWGRDYIDADTENMSESDLSAKEETEEKAEKEITGDVSPKEETVTADIYFPDANVINLKAEKRQFANDSELAKNVLLAVMAGPESDELLPSLAGDFKLLSVSHNKSSGTCTIDLSAEFAKYNTGSTAVETMAVYSIVNSLCSLEGISDVKIDIEGNKKASFGHFDISEPIQPDMTMVK